MHWWNWGGKAKIKSKYLSYFDVAKLYYKHPTFPLQQQQKKKLLHCVIIPTKGHINCESVKPEILKKIITKPIVLLIMTIS